MPASVQLAISIAASACFRRIQRRVNDLLTRRRWEMATVNVRYVREGPAMGVNMGVKGGDITHDCGALQWTSHAYGVV